MACANSSKTCARRPKVDDGLLQRARAALAEPEVSVKLAAVRALRQDWLHGAVALADHDFEPPPGQPGRPARPLLLQPRQMPRRALTSQAGRKALIHAIAHIEFNAVNLALDAVARFPGLPPAYYGDWLQVATEEARHFGLLAQRLEALGSSYGALPAHDGLWSMARRTAHDPMVRMALIPRVLEARGLDVTPGMIERLRAVGDHDSCAILELILREEVGHVAIGSRWFRYLCDQRGLVPEAEFQRLLGAYLNGALRGPINREARLKAGFTRAELSALERAAAARN